MPARTFMHKFHHVVSSQGWMLVPLPPGFAAGGMPVPPGYSPQQPGAGSVPPPPPPAVRPPGGAAAAGGKARAAKLDSHGERGHRGCLGEGRLGKVVGAEICGERGGGMA